MPPAVAIVILNYNGQHYLGECLASLARQTVPVRSVVADNGSTDDSLPLVREKFPHAQIMAFGQNLHFAAGYNRAIHALTAEWIGLVNNDAALAPDWVERLLLAAEHHPQAAILGGKILFSNTPGRIVQCAGASLTNAGTAFEIGWGQPDDGQYDQPRVVGAISGAALFVRRQTFLDLGGFDPGYVAYLEDVDLCWRAWLRGREVRYVPEAVAWHRFGGTAGGRASPFRIRCMQRNRLANMVKHLERGTALAGVGVSLLYDLYRVLEYGLRRDGAALRALWEGTLTLRREWPQWQAQRAPLQKTRRLPDSELYAHGLLVSALDAFREYRRLSRVVLPQQGRS